MHAMKPQFKFLNFPLESVVVYFALYTSNLIAEEITNAHAFTCKVVHASFCCLSYSRNTTLILKYKIIG